MDNTLLEIFENESDQVLDIVISLDKIHCFDEGDGFGKAEPYLWAVYFKIDGDKAYFETIETLNLAGTTSIHKTKGSHGNLNVKNVNAGDIVPIPEKIGKWKTKLLPIPIHEYQNWALAQGVIGVFCVLMEQDNMSTKGANAGYNTLVKTLQEQLEETIPSLSERKRNLSKEELSSFAEEIKKSIKSNISKNQNMLQNLWTFINQDDVIGWECFLYTHPQLIGKKKKRFSQRWKNEGDWKIEGSISIQ